MEEGSRNAALFSYWQRLPISFQREKDGRTGIIIGASWEGNGTAAPPVAQTGAEVLHPPCGGRCLLVNYHYSKPRKRTQRAAASLLGTDRSSGFPLRDCIYLRSKPRKEMQSVPSSYLNWQKTLQPLRVRRFRSWICHWLKPRMKAWMVLCILVRLEWSFSGIYWRCVWVDPSYGVREVEKTYRRNLWLREWFLNSKPPLWAVFAENPLLPSLQCFSAQSEQPSPPAGTLEWTLCDTGPSVLWRSRKVGLCFSVRSVVCSDSVSQSLLSVFGQHAFFRCVGILKRIPALSGRIRCVYRSLLSVSVRRG